MKNWLSTTSIALALTLTVGCNNSNLSPESDGAIENRRDAAQNELTTADESEVTAESTTDEAEFALFRGQRTITIRVTNLTKSQVLTPPAVIVHRRPFKLFNLGAPASDALTTMAEDGGNGEVIASASENNAVFATAASDGPVMPGTYRDIQVTLPGYRLWGAQFTVAGMLATTNDSFFAIQGQRFWDLRRGVYAQVYDAGSEANSESCAHIPGPPCGNGGVRNAEGAEGFIHLANGISGDAELSRGQFDWRGPAAKIEILY